MNRRLDMKKIIGPVVLAFSSVLCATEYKAVPGELIVKLKDGASKSFFSNKSLNSLGISHRREIKLSYGNLHVLKVDQSASFKSVQSELILNDEIEYAEPNFIYEIVKPIEQTTLQSLFSNKIDRKLHYTPADPMFDKLWGLHNSGPVTPTEPTPTLGEKNRIAGADIDALKAWSVTKGSRVVKVAVIDTGIDYNHPDLKDQMMVNELELNGTKGVDDDGNGFVDDIYGYDFASDDGDPLDGHSHGTHCAGTIGAAHNEQGVAGVMADVSLLAIKFLSDSGAGTSEGAIKAIDYATSRGVDIMSNSWGGGPRSSALKEAIQRASDAGIIFTAAAGNSSTNNDLRPHYPSNYNVENVIAVAASTAKDELAGFSQYGKKSVHIAAPGHEIMSTVNGGGYKAYSGTSMATPHVSGALGLLIAREGRMPHKELKERLLATSEQVSSLRGKTLNSGRLNAYNLLIDFRPKRIEPKPDAWVELPLGEVWESKHPYQPKFNEAREFKVDGAKFIRLKVAEYDIEKKYDYLEILNSSEKSVEKFFGKGENRPTEYVIGDYMKVRFHSDHSVTRWGFRIESIEVQY